MQTQAFKTKLQMAGLCGQLSDAFASLVPLVWWFKTYRGPLRWNQAFTEQMAPIECGFGEFYSQSWIDKPFQNSLVQQASPMSVKMHVVDTGDLHFNLTH